MTAYYNEFEPFAADWLENLIAAGHIAPGVVDRRDIRDVTPNELKQYTQVHLFAGIGTWSLALRNAGWSDDRPVWTVSCPCQPFSAAGAGKAFDDKRHLWPFVERLIAQRKPAKVFGEQVSSKLGRAWFEVVQADMENNAYAVGKADLCAAGIGAPHIRQRLYFIAEWLADARSKGLPKRESKSSIQQEAVGSLAWKASVSSSDTGYWGNSDWIECDDGKCRSIEPGTFPLANGVAERVGLIRGYGNGIVEPLARLFIQSYLETGA